MSIFGTVKSAIGKVGSAISGLFSGGSSSNAAAATLTYPVSTPKTNVPNASLIPNISTPYGIGQTQPNGSVILVSGQGVPTGGVVNPSGSVMSSASYGGVPISSGNNSSLPSPIYNAPTNYTPAPTTLTASSSPSSMSINADALSAGSSTPVALPAKPGYTNPGQINNGGLISALSATYAFDPNTNTFTQKTDTTNPLDAEAQLRAEEQKKLLEDIPQKQNLYQDPAIIAQQQEVNQRKQEVANYTAQLNSIVAKQNADLLTLRGVGSKEGVTETVYGGQQAEINREAAIKALPVQAQISAAQGNLSLAQDYLTQLSTFKTEQINNDYAYKTALYNSIKDFVTGEDKIRLEAKQKAEDRAYQLKRDNISSLDALIKEYKDNPSAIGVLSRMYDRAGTPNFGQELARLAAGISTASGSGTLPVTTANGTVNVPAELAPYYKTSYEGTPYVDLSSLTPSDKAKYAQLATRNGLTPILDAGHAEKIDAIAVAKENLQNISTSLVSQNLLNNKTIPSVQGGVNSVKSFLGNADIKSFSAWRTAIINNLQALAGGQGSGLRINGAEIQAAIDNDLPNLTGKNADNLASAQAKIQKLNSQLDVWSKRLLGNQAMSQTSASQSSNNPLGI